MRTGITVRCGEVVRKHISKDFSHIEEVDALCGKTVSERAFRKEVCAGCGNDKGSGHTSTTCVAGGSVVYLSVNRSGAYCEDGHRYPFESSPLVGA